jgi:uncharacterized membrane protein YcaP (DUF421 family)
MDAVIRGLAVYFFLLLVFRISGKRSINQITMFDFVMLLIISETTQQALLADDFSVTNAFILIVTLIGADIFMSFLKDKFKKVDKVVDGIPTILVNKGKLVKEALDNTRVGEDDILESARKIHGLERMDQINYAILEKDGNISVIPKGMTLIKSE